MSKSSQYHQPTVSITPATLAVMVQLAALMILFFGLQLIQSFYSFHFPLSSLVIMQALLAVTLSVVARMAAWWRWIHGIFPVALFLMSQWTLPTELYLFGFIICLGVFWTTFRSQVPFFPSRPTIWQQVAKLIPEGEAKRVVEIGSGLGDLAMTVAKLRPNSRVEGIEVAPLPWLISQARALLSRSNAAFTLGDYYALNFADYDLVFAYLSPAAMPQLYEKAKVEMTKGSLLVSYEFTIPGVKPSVVLDQQGTTPALYIWVM